MDAKTQEQLDRIEAKLDRLLAAEKPESAPSALPVPDDVSLALAHVYDGETDYANLASLCGVHRSTIYRSKRYAIVRATIERILELE